MEPREKDGDPVTLQRIVELEVAPDLPGRERKDRTTQDELEREERENARAEEGGGGRSDPVRHEDPGTSGNSGSSGRSGPGRVDSHRIGGGNNSGSRVGVRTEDGKIVISGGGKGGGRL